MYTVHGQCAEKVLTQTDKRAVEEVEGERDNEKSS